MTGEEIRLQIVLAVVANAPQGFDPASVIERARVIETFVSSGNPKGPERVTGTISIGADKTRSPRNT